MLDPVCVSVGGVRGRSGQRQQTRLIGLIGNLHNPKTCNVPLVYEVESFNLTRRPFNAATYIRVLPANLSNTNRQRSKSFW